MFFLLEKQIYLASFRSQFYLIPQHKKSKQFHATELVDSHKKEIDFS